MMAAEVLWGVIGDDVAMSVVKKKGSSELRVCPCPGGVIHSRILHKLQSGVVSSRGLEAPCPRCFPNIEVSASLQPPLMCAMAFNINF